MEFVSSCEREFVADAHFGRNDFFCSLAHFLCFTCIYQRCTSIWIRFSKMTLIVPRIIIIE
jgi:hypothetical protein